MKIPTIIIICLFYQFTFSQTAATIPPSDFVLDTDQTLVINSDKIFNHLKLNDNSTLILNEKDSISITCKTIDIGNNVTIKISGNNGLDGENGIDGGRGDSCRDGRNGGNAEAGKPGENSPAFSFTGNILTYGSLKIITKGGAGGNGGIGGNGGKGGQSRTGDLPFDCRCGPGDGGNGGNGGNGAFGGNSGNVYFFYEAESDVVNSILNNFQFISSPGENGRGGYGGRKGEKGSNTTNCSPSKNGNPGKQGLTPLGLPKQGEIYFNKINLNDCSNNISTSIFIFSGYENIDDKFYSITNKLKNSISNNLTYDNLVVFENKSKNEIIDIFDQLKEGTSPHIDSYDDSQLLIFFIGHGTLDDRDSFYIHSFPLEEKVYFSDILTRIENSEIDNVLTVVNSCFSGKIHDSNGDYIIKNISKSDPKIITMNSCGGKSRAFLTSSYGSELSDKTSFLKGLIAQLELITQDETINNIYLNMMNSEIQMNGVRPTIGYSNTSLNNSRFIFYKKN
ncbi:hypothetical protein [Mangrovimonas xylaniphaga]|uniref:hypothetical protein n=1 Tax=Mangrovimonas xylaniphaga TaxID=1645915 RepID=UPI0006B5CDD6|nr:hypothetical protein [Mangrovimonas xylaniphaga]